MALHANSLAQLLSASPPCGFLAPLLHVFEVLLSNMQWNHIWRWRSSGFGLVVLSSGYGCLSARWAVWDTAVRLRCMRHEEVSTLVSRTMTTPVPEFSVNPWATEKYDSFLLSLPSDCSHPSQNTDGRARASRQIDRLGKWASWEIRWLFNVG